MMMTKIEVSRLHTLKGHRDAVYTLEGGKESHDIFSGSGDGMVVHWNLTDPEEGTVIAKLPHSVYALHYLREESLLVAGHNYEGIHFVDVQLKKEVKSLKMTAAAIFDIQSFGRNLFVATGDGVVTVVDHEHLQILKKLSHAEKSARSMAVNAVRRELAVAYSDNYIRIFDLDTFQLKLEWEAHTSSVFTLAYTPDHKVLFSGSRDARLKIWDADAGYLQIGEIVAHMYAINHIVFSPNGKHFVTCSMDKSIKVWDAEEMKLLKVIDKARHAGHGTSVNKLLWSSFSNQLVSASDDRTLSVWDLFFKLNNNDQS
jgi:WD40 repeat protein